MHEAHISDQLFRLYNPQYGNGNGDGLVYYKHNLRRQKGAGLGAIFGAIGRKLLPFIKNIIIPQAKKYALPHATAALKNVARDVIQGENVMHSLKEHSTSAIKKIGDDIINQSGSGIRRVRTSRKRKRSSVKRKTKKRKATKTKKNQKKTKPKRRKKVLSIFD